MSDNSLFCPFDCPYRIQHLSLGWWCAETHTKLNTSDRLVLCLRSPACHLQEHTPTFKPPYPAGDSLPPLEKVL